MNRNVNMTGNFSSGKSLKPGDTAFNQRKMTGGDQYGNRIMNTNSNFNMKNTASEMNLGKDKYKFSENDMNEAKESLKLLKIKMGGMNSNGSLGINKINSNSNFGGSNLQNNNLKVNTTTNANSNYRKPFKPSFNNEESDLIQVDTNKKVVGARTHNIQMTQANKTSTMSSSNNNNNNNNNKQNLNPNSNLKNKNIIPAEVEDDRPAFAQGDTNIKEFDNEEDDGDRVECNTCGRRFKEEAYEKHSKVCKKVFATKRKAFDVKKQRIIDSEHATMLKHQEFEEKKKSKIGANNNKAIIDIKATKKNKWKKQSEEFRAILKANNIIPDPVISKNGKKTGTKYNSKATGFVNTPSVITEDYSLCNMCNRKYNENAYSKHLPTCERRTKEALMKNKPKAGSTNTNLNGTYGSKPNLNVKFGKK